ncbi:hypothetical protein BH24DEI2_BH24DEI2_19760 [soil metagenome]
MESWADALRQRRLQFGMSQQDVVTASGEVLYQAEVSRLERGVVHPTEDISLEKFFALLKALEWTLEDFAEATGLSFPFASQEQAEALQAVSRLEVRPDWLRLPVYGAVAAGKEDAKPLNDEHVYIPREKLRSKGADPDKVKVYLVNGDCMISNEAQRIQKNIAPGDYVAVDSSRTPQPGDVVVAWWPREDKMVVKRYKIEGKDIVLYPVNPAHPNLVLDREEDVFILGTVVWRGG